ncbi:hypothetical protein PIB30_056825 [Stylosanthes scabra]|uniref:Uncharacterized protein n=1 Tax=Stylosanthes scabra TaxID=79078 RepID=A0ABU6WHQ4_9FABA|nr:hypothetical protein [Stylosanthes scabra]
MRSGGDFISNNLGDWLKRVLMGKISYFLMGFVGHGGQEIKRSLLKLRQFYERSLMELRVPLNSWHPPSSHVPSLEKKIEKNVDHKDKGTPLKKNPNKTHKFY